MLVLIELIIFSTFTVFYLDGKGVPFANERTIDSDKNIEFDSTEVNSKNRSWYNVQTITGLKPGKYVVTIDPIGENITVVLKTSYDTVEKNITHSCEMNIKVGSSVWQAILIEDPPAIDFDTPGGSFTIDYKKVDENYEITTVAIIGGAMAGGVILAVNTARVHRRDRE